MEIQYSHELTPEMLSAFESSPFTTEQFAGMGKVRKIVRAGTVPSDGFLK